MAGDALNRTRSNWSFMVCCLIVGFVGIRAGTAIDRAIRARTAVSTRSNYSPISRPPQVTSDEIFRTAVDEIEQEFVGPGSDSSDEHMRDAAIASIVASLKDTSARYLPPGPATIRREQLRGIYQGIGADLTIATVMRQDVDYQYLTVQTVVSHGSAIHAGLKSGDHITEVNGRWVIAYSATNATGAGRDASAITAKRAIDLLSSSSTGKVTLTIERIGSAPFHVTLPLRRAAGLNHHQTACGSRAEMITVRAFDRSLIAYADRIIDTAVQQHRALIIDLRQSDGGVYCGPNDSDDALDAALHVLSRLSPSVAFGKIERHPGKLEDVVRERNTQAAIVPVFVLIDSGTSGLSEFVASSLKSCSKAQLIGEKSFGKPELMQVAALRGGGALELTYGKLHAASGAALDSGIAPDLKTAPKTAQRDPALEASLVLVGR